MKYRAQERQTLEWYVKMMACLDSLSPEERAGFDKWDRERYADQTTSDWPGFEKVHRQTAIGSTASQLTHFAE